MKNRLLQFVQISMVGFVLATVPAISSAAGTIQLAGANSVTVHYADLDLTRADGAQVLYQRLKNAANQVCGVRVGARDVFNVALAKDQCVKTALAQAIRSIHNDQLDALYYKGDSSRQKS